MEGFGILTTIIAVPVHKSGLKPLAEAICKFNSPHETDFYIEQCIYKDEKAQEFPFQGIEILGIPQFWVAKSLYVAPPPDIHELAIKCPNCDLYFICGYNIRRHVIRNGKVVEILIPKYTWQAVPEEPKVQ